MNPLRRFRPLLIVLAVALIASACGDDSGSPSGPVIASLADREFTQGELDSLLPDGDNTVPTRIASVVESWLAAQAVELEVADRGYPVTEEDRELATEQVNAQSSTRNDTEKQLLIDAVAISFAVGRWSEVAVEEAGEPDPPNYLCSNHLLVETEEEAADALQRFNDGEAFADLAMELSTGPSGPSGGDLGCAVEGQFVPEFEEAAYAASGGDVVGPVETSFGWHLIEVESVGPATAEIHPTAEPGDLARIAVTAQRAQFDVLVAELEREAGANFRDEAFVDESIGTLADDSLTVTAPGADDNG
ncbi:MAG: peptidylprolyl isomerase [Actinomycetota bacterium]